MTEMLFVQVRHFRDGVMVGEGGDYVRFNNPTDEELAYRVLTDDRVLLAALLCQAGTTDRTQSAPPAPSLSEEL